MTLKLKAVLKQLGKPQADLARVLDLSGGTIAQLVNHSQWPKSLDRDALKQKIEMFLEESGADASTVSTAFEPEEPLPTALQHTAMSQEDEPMLLRKQRLTPDAKKTFGIYREPFDELASPDEMWISPDIRYVRESMLQTARYGGFIAVVGQSGSGKSTLRRDLAQRIQDESHPVILVEPYTVEAEDSDIKGKRFKSSDITSALLAAVAPTEKPKINPQARFAQLHRALKDSHAAGYRHCVVIEEAHCLPVPTLKHLKRILELEVGFTKLVSVILIGQTELGDKLSIHRMDVREVVQRCELVTLNPIDPGELKEFLTFRFGKAGCQSVEFLNESAIPALIHRLQLPDRKRDTRVSNLYPLAIGNLVTAAMNLAAELGLPVVDEEVINGVS
ncbi:ExeA family protein [Marinobacterium litorale]|uniref:ExeA family protein n=1 Tax=Marinobacterium litorale TaxID=404770 RepID=UPI0004144673|nr:AAA family ATPase [Marinobacterium litorale]